MVAEELWRVDWSGEPWIMGRIHLRQPGGIPYSPGRMVCPLDQKIFSLESADAALGETDRLRCASQLEADLRKLFGVLLLSGSASGPLEIIAV